MLCLAGEVKYFISAWQWQVVCWVAGDMERAVVVIPLLVELVFRWCNVFAGTTHDALEQCISKQ